MGRPVVCVVRPCRREDPSVSGWLTFLCRSPLYRRHEDISFSPHSGVTFSLTADSIYLFRYDAIWRLGTPGVVAYYSARVASTHPPVNSTLCWMMTTNSSHPLPLLISGAGQPLSTCSPPAPGPLKKNCTCPSCVEQWGPAGCPDLYSVPADLVRPAMLNDTAPARGSVCV